MSSAPEARYLGFSFPFLIRYKVCSNSQDLVPQLLLLELCISFLRINVIKSNIHVLIREKLVHFNVTWITHDLRFGLFCWLRNLPLLFFWKIILSHMQNNYKAPKGPIHWMMNGFPLHSPCLDIWVTKHFCKCFTISKFDPKLYL